ncbi:hypothetical protein [Micromonospora sp. NBC_00421]|uniref:hypothetical protein n=1 Tax=Micromonospora sp. NBC_00421 TaxID=2975976 RepID=UPI002E1C6026
MAHHVDDVWADVLHYYGRDIWQMDGAAVMKLAWRLIDIVDVDTAVSPARYRSSVIAALTAATGPAGPAADETVDPDEVTEATIARLGLDDVIEIVTVTDPGEEPAAEEV